MGATDDRPTCPHAAAGKLPPRGAKHARVISASKRTDIPAHYVDWAVERFRAGWVDVPNPMFRHADPARASSHVWLGVDEVKAIVWWSKDYGPYLRRAGAFARYRRQFFQFSINPHAGELSWLEPDTPDTDTALAQAVALARLPGGPGMVAWRYDPICFWREGGELRSSWDPGFFERVCRSLTAVGIRRCFTSIADLYTGFVRRVARRYPGREPVAPPDEALRSLAGEMAEIARGHGMALLTCCEPRLLALDPYFGKGACIDGALLGATTAAATDRRMRGREQCGCTRHTDIGSYAEQPCRFSCVYCYATRAAGG